MNIFHKVTGRTLRLNRTRTGVTIIGILLSAAMITAVVSLVVSAQAFFTDMACYENGNWHTRLVGVSETELEELRSDNKIEDLCPMRILGSEKKIMRRICICWRPERRPRTFCRFTC